MKYAFIKVQSQHHKVSRLVSTLGVSTSGYYAWLIRPESTRTKINQALLTKIKLFHKASRCIVSAAPTTPLTLAA